MILEEKQGTNTVLMVRPVSFGFNAETNLDNAFQNRIDLNEDLIQQKALLEFDEMVLLLRENGIHVLVIEDTLLPNKPDSIFPNNWFSTHADGRVGLYPLKAENRRHERRPEILEYLVEEKFAIKHIEDFTQAEEEAMFLESTGSLVLDRENKISYISVSERSHPELVVEFCDVFGYQPIFLQSIIEDNPVYHTNVAMCIASNFALIALETFSRNDERLKVKNALEASGKEIIEITEKQVLSFAGNGLELKNNNGNSCFVLSKGAYASLTVNQIQAIEKYSKVLTPDLTTIETIGGGSARCMMAEIFLPYQRK